MHFDFKGKTINVVLLEQSFGVPGSVIKNDDDSYTIFVDATLSVDMQRKVFYHEMGHIICMDFEKSDVQEIEKYAHETYNEKWFTKNCSNY